MNDNKKQLEKWAELDCDSINFDDLESKLTSELEEQMSDLELLEQDRLKFANWEKGHRGTAHYHRPMLACSHHESCGKQQDGITSPEQKL